MLLKYTQEQLIQMGSFKRNDLDLIYQRRRDHNRLGFAYQLTFVRLANYFPSQLSFETIEEILHFVSSQIEVRPQEIQLYAQRRETIAEHQERIREYLLLQKFGETEKNQLEQFLFDELFRLDQISLILSRAEQFLRDNNILRPSFETLRRLVIKQREKTRKIVFTKVAESLPQETIEQLDKLLKVENGRISGFQTLKEAPKFPSPKAILHLIEKLEKVELTGILLIDLAWLNNNYQRTLTRYAQRCSADRMRRLQNNHRYTTLTCFLCQVYRDTLDHIVDMYDKLITRVHNHAQKDVDEQLKKQQNLLRESLVTLREMGTVLLDEEIEDTKLRDAIFKKISKESLKAKLSEIETVLSGKHSHVFNLIVQRFSYLRQFAPAMLKHLEIQLEGSHKSTIPEAIEMLRQMNEDGKRKLPDDPPVDFIPKKIRPIIFKEDGVSKAAWECALLDSIRNEIKSGNLSIKHSKRFGRFDDFFIPVDQWRREEFFKRAKFPTNPQDVESYLKERLNKAFDDFLQNQPKNTYAQADEDGWHLSIDSAEKLSSETEAKLEQLKSWLSDNLRTIKLPELLIEVDNDLRFTRHFMTTVQQEQWEIENICTILATVMAHGCNIGTYTMSRLIDGISYRQIKNLTDWQLTEESQRAALAELVSAISQLDVTQYWGEGRTSSSDGQRFTFKRKSLQRTYSPKFSDFALEFYSFVADNYAPFYSTPIECTDRDAAYVLDGLLYNESDLALEEHYTDTHGYTEINFAAFAMLGKQFSPRIRGIHKQRIYRIDTEKDYASLSSLVSRSDRTIHMDWICDQWDRMGQFYSSLEEGHATASMALKRLASYNGKNHFYRANRELGRVFKTEHILNYMSDPLLRRRTRRGLLKGEQIHALARDVSYGKRGRISTRDLQEQKNTCSCLTLIMACIIYWQSKEINRVISECNPTTSGIDLSMIEHISPIGWENVILYGEYVLNRNLVKI